MDNNRLIIRVSNKTMAFAVSEPTADHQAIYEPFLTRSSISIAANLREAFHSASLLSRNYQRAQLIVDTPPLLIPLQEADEENFADLYYHTFTGMEGCNVQHQVLPNLNAIVVFAVNRDLQLVVSDHFADVRITHLLQPLWAHMLNRSYTGMRRKLYAYFHDHCCDMFAFDKNRFRFFNRYDTTSPNDITYHLLHVWKTLAMDPKDDELHLAYAIGQPTTADDATKRQQTTDLLRRYVAKVFTMNPTAELNRARITQIKAMPLDLMLSLI